MKEISALIFDCDGVMFDSKDANISFYNHLLAHFDLGPLKYSDIEYIHMHTSEECVRRIFKDSAYEEEAQELRRQASYSAFIRDMKMEPGLIELLDSLKPRFGLAIATNRSDTIKEVVNIFDLEGYFDIIVSCLEVKKPKPHPEQVERILTFFGIEPEEALFIGDSELDAEASRAAGVPFVAYKNMSLTARHHIASLLEVKEIIDGRCLKHPSARDNRD